MLRTISEQIEEHFKGTFEDEIGADGLLKPDQVKRIIEMMRSRNGYTFTEREIQILWKSYENGQAGRRREKK